MSYSIGFIVVVCTHKSRTLIVSSFVATKLAITIILTSYSQVPTVSVMTSASGSAVAGEEYSITCAVMGADNLDATFRVEWQLPGGGTLRIGLMSSLTHTFSPLGQGDAGEYTCEATITTDLLLGSPLTRTGMLDISVAGKSVSVCVCIKYMYELSSFKQ